MSETARRTVLSNGLTVITKEIHQVPIASFWVWYRVGSRNESEGTSGISHWVEHMMFKGTPTFPKGAIFRAVNGSGGVMNAFTWIDYTAYFETLPSSRIGLAIAIESDRMANSLFDPEEVESERTVIISEREGSENSPTTLLAEELNAAAFQAHPYGHPVIGWKTDLQRMTRDDLYNHYRAYYAPNNATVVAVGDFDTDAALGTIREKFEPIPRGPEVPALRAIEPPQRGERRVTVRYPAGAPYFEAAYHGPAVSSPDLFPMLVLDAVLSGGKPMGMFGARGTRMGRSSRLYRALVDTGLATSAGSGMALTRDPHLFGVDATLRSGVTPEQVERVVVQEVGRVTNENVTEQELARARKQVRAQIVYASESVSDQGYWLGALDAIGSPHSYWEMMDRIEGVTPEDVKRVAQQYLVESNRTVGVLIPTNGKPAGAAAEGNGVLARAYFYSGGSGGSTGGSGRISLAMERRQLPNGITVLTSRDDTTPQVSVRANLVAGAAFDTPERSGLARFVAPMLIRGTAKRSFQQLNEETDNIGLALAVDAGRLMAQVGFRSLKEDFARGLEILADVLRRPTFPAEEMEKLRGQIITSLRQQDTSPRAVAERLFLEEVYPSGHPYHLWPSGTQTAISGIVREDLEGFYRGYYRPDTLTIAVVGDIDPARALEALGNALGDWRAEGERPSLEIPQVELPPHKVREEAVPGKFQSEIVMGLPALSRKDPDFYAMRLGNLILGELGLSGRLGAHIRDKMGLAYHVSSDVQASVGPSPWTIRAGVNPANVDRAIDAAMKEIEQWRSELVAPEEIRDGKNFLIGSLPIAMETNEGVARTLLDIEFYQLGLDYLKRYPGLIEAVTPEAIRSAVAKWIHPENMVVVVAGPKR